MAAAAVTVCLFVLAGCYFVSRRSHSLINPITLYAPLFIAQVVLAPWAYFTYGLTSSSSDAINTTIWLSLIHFLCIGTAFLIPVDIFSAPLKVVLPKREPAAGAPLFSFILFLGSFAALMVLSGGTLWLTSPREAYQFHRAGVGVLWSLSQAFLVLTCSLSIRRLTSPASVLARCAIFAVVAYFLGSKAFVLFHLVIGILFIEFRIRKIPRMLLALVPIAMLALHVALQEVQGTANNLMDVFQYFDYFSNTARFVEHFQEFGYRFGRATLSSLWAYVPRAVYPGKPYDYGVLQIMEHFNPGAAEAFGATPGILPWAASYLDFGCIGVVIDGLLMGLVAKSAFKLFRTSTSTSSFLLFLQIGTLLASYFAVFYAAPFPVFVIWLYVSLCCLQIVSSSMRLLWPRGWRQVARGLQTEIS